MVRTYVQRGAKSNIRTNLTLDRALLNDESNKSNPLVARPGTNR